MLSTSQEGRGYPAGHRGRNNQGFRIPDGARVLHIARPEAVEVVRPGCRSWCGCSWREAARVVGDGVAVVVRPDAVVFVVAHGVKLLRSGRGCAHLPSLKRSRCVCLLRVLHLINIYITRKQTILIQKQNFLCFYLVVSKYICIFAAEIITKRINNIKY